MYDFLSVDILEAIDDAEHKGLYFRSGEVGADADEFVQGLVFAEFQKYVDILLVLKAVIKFYDVGMVQGFVEFDFVGQPQPGAVRLQLLLEHYFGGCLLAGFGVFGDEAVGEAALAQ